MGVERVPNGYLTSACAVAKPVRLRVRLLADRTQFGEGRLEVPFSDIASVDVLVEENPTVHLRCHWGDTFPAAAGKRDGVVGPAVRQAVTAAI